MKRQSCRKHNLSRGKSRQNFVFRFVCEVGICGNSLFTENLEVNDFVVKVKYEAENIHKNAVILDDDFNNDAANCENVCHHVVGKNNGRCSTFDNSNSNGGDIKSFFVCGDGR